MQEGEGDDPTNLLSPEKPTSPAPDWSLEDYQRAHFIAALRKDVDAASNIDKAFRNSSFAPSEEVIAEWEGWRELAYIPAGSSVNLKILRDRTEKYPDNAQLKELLGRGLAHYGDEKGAAEAYYDAAQLAKAMKIAARTVKRILESEKTPTDFPSSTRFILLLHRLPQETHEDKLSFVDAMQSISQTGKLTEVSKAIAEVGLSLAPEDISARFQLARRYADDEQHNLSLLHYQNIPRDERSGMAWNNLGVSYAKLNIIGLAAKSYETAAKFGETIADGNLAQILSSIGLFDDAQQRVEKAISIPEHHDSLVGVLSSIKEARDIEEVHHLDQVSKAKEQQVSRISLGRAALDYVGAEIEGKWITPAGLIELSCDEDGRYSGVGQIVREVKQGGLFGLASATSMRFHASAIKIKLARIGNALEGTLTVVGSPEPLSLLGAFDFEKRLVFQVSEDGTTLDGLEIGYDEKRVFWRRADSLAIIANSMVPNSNAH
ncbi:hypothetical protein [Rhizobium sp. PL01]|uniref:hypothetical protein n=1 Tax=Rhizobium sp. PL01 TaxID=3085631 RepID=UPI002980C7A8|nr:hypothetical protein [Rhizobium sp. PL01]MDW5313376.1 hypothetical protein [Rhizobium sp. PL01]